MEIKIEKIYKEQISIRDYIVSKAYEQGEDIIVNCNGQKMTIPHINLLQGRFGTIEFESKHDGKPYKLVDYHWIPDKDKPIANQITLFDYPPINTDSISKKLGDWWPIIGDQFQETYMKRLAAFLRKRRKQVTVYPEPENVLKALELTPYNEVKCIIISQDPYTDNSAHGLAFGLNPKSTNKVPPSLREIINAVEQDTGALVLDDSLEHWAKQGVLLLNKILTVEKGKPLSHANEGWEIFTEEIVHNLNKLNKPIVWMLWGKEAKEFESLINNPNHLILTFVHPVAPVYSGNKWTCKHFSECNNYLKSKGIKEISW